MSRRRAAGLVRDLVARVAWRLLLTAAVLTAASALIAVAAPRATAGVFDVYSCTAPDGQPAPTEDWTQSSQGTVGPDSGDSDTCPEGGSLTASVSAQAPQNAYAGPQWVFQVPAGSTIVGGTLTATLTSPHGQAWLGSPSPVYDAADVLANCQYNLPCGQAGSLSGVFAVTHPGATSIYAIAVCVGAYEGATTCPASIGIDAAVSVKAADIELATSSAPSASAVGGSLPSETTLDGPQNILITASDPGPGVYEAIFQIDGKTIASQVLNSNAGRCENVAPAGSSTPAFLYTDPCPAQVNSVDVPFNPAQVSDGPHELRVLVSDAAGDATTILDRQIVVDNGGAYTTLLARGQCNGDPCDDHAQLVASSKQAASFPRRFGHSATTLTGRLLDHAGAAIVGARVRLSEQPAEAGAALTEVQSVSTGQSGEWALRVPRGPSRMLQVAYYSHLKDTTPAATLVYHEHVRAAVSLQAARRVRVGHTVVFYGHLAGGYIPLHGEPVQIEIRYDGRWRTIEVLNTDAHGRFAYRYVFSLGAGSSYRFRAIVRYSPAYPFAAAASRPVAVKVRR